MAPRNLGILPGSACLDTGIMSAESAIAHCNQAATWRLWQLIGLLPEILSAVVNRHDTAIKRSY